MDPPCTNYYMIESGYMYVVEMRNEKPTSDFFRPAQYLELQAVGIAPARIGAALFKA